MWLRAIIRDPNPSVWRVRLVPEPQLAGIQIETPEFLMLKLRDSLVNGHNNFLWLDKPKSMFLHLWDILISVRVAASALFGTKSLDVDFITSSASISLFSLIFCHSEHFFLPLLIPFSSFFPSVHHFLFLSLSVSLRARCIPTSVSLAVPQAISDGLLRSSGRTENSPAGPILLRAAVELSPWLPVTFVFFFCCWFGFCFEVLRRRS